MPKLSESFNAKIKAFRAQFRGVRDRAFSYIDLLNYMLKYKIPQIVTLILELDILSYLEGLQTKKAPFC